jgi:hypothetical protein
MRGGGGTAGYGRMILAGSLSFNPPSVPGDYFFSSVFSFFLSASASCCALRARFQRR